MALPTFVAAAAKSSGTAALTPALPAGIAVNDILLLFIDTDNTDTVPSITNANGGTWTLAQEDTSSEPRGSLYWSRYNGTQGAPTIAAKSLGQMAVIAAWRGCLTTGTPVVVLGHGVSGTASTAISIATGTTTSNDNLVIGFVASSNATGTANRFSGWADASLANLTERIDTAETVTGLLAVIGVVEGQLATAGAAGTITATQVDSSFQARIAVALLPAPAAVDAAPRTLLWDVRSPVDAAARTLKWDLATQVNAAARTLLWDLRSQVNAAARTLLWDLRAAVNAAARTLIWDLAAGVGAVNALPRTLVWDLRSQVDAAPRTLLWDIRNPVDAAARTLKWDLVAQVDASPRTLLWDLAAAATAQRFFRLLEPSALSAEIRLDPTVQSVSAFVQGDARNPGAAASVAGSFADWVSPANALAEDGNNANSWLGGASGYSSTDVLKLTGLGYSIPAGATILGIEVVPKETGFTDYAPGLWVQDKTVQLYKAGTLVGTNKARTGSSSGAHDYAHHWTYQAYPEWASPPYGGASDLWGTTWTPADINNAGFGVGIAAQKQGSGSGSLVNVYPNVDVVKVTVYYLVPGTEVAVTGQPTLRFGPDEPEATRIIRSAEFSTVMPAGVFDTATLTIPKANVDPAPYLMAQVILREYETGRTLYEGRLVGISDSGTDYQLECESWANHLEDNQTVREIFMDRDLNSWQADSLSDKIGYLNTGNWQSVDDPSVIWDRGAGIPALELGSDAVHNTSGKWQLATALYDSGGALDLPLGGFDFAWKKASTATVLDSGGANGGISVGVADSDTYGAATDNTDITGVAGPGSGTRLAATHLYSAYLSYWFNPNSPADGQHVGIDFTLLGVFSRHGLTLRGSLTLPNIGRGLYVSDMVPYLVSQYAPLLAVGDVEVTSGFIVPHAAYKDRTTARAIIDELVAFGGNSFHPMDWWIEEGRTFRLASPENHGTTWRLRLEDGNEQSGLGPDAQELLNGVVLTFDPAGDGSKHTIGPPGADANNHYNQLLDISDTNPANRDGARHWAFVDAGITSEPGALMLGQVTLAEHGIGWRDWRGSIEVKGQIRDSNSVWQPVALVRAGDYVVVEDDPGGDYRPRRIESTSYDHASQTLTANIATEPPRLEPFLARLGVVLTGRI